MKTSELTGAALDWAVAKCEYDNNRYNYGSPCFDPNTKRIYETQGLQQIGVNFAPSTDWKQGGPIVEREGINVNKEAPLWWAHREQLPHCYYEADRPLIAAMRCYVASKLGDDIEIPTELLGESK